MKIINATWEKRNFGLDTYEIIIDKKDLRNFDEIYLKIKEQKYKNAYVVIKMPVGNIAVVHKLEDDGFRFLETQLYLADHFDIDQADLKIADSVQTQGVEDCIMPKNKELWDKIISMITPGMFDTDRVSLDPKLGKEIACKRYQNWCKDLYEKPGSIMHITKYKGEICGFGIDEIDNETGSINGVLGGVFEKYKNIGIGISWIYPSKNKKTAVSSNNLSVLKIHQHCGRVIYKERYVLRKIYQ